MNMRNVIRGLVLVIAIFCSGEAAQAQDLFKTKDLTQLRVEQLSDADVQKLKIQLSQNNITIDQAERIALSKGMSAAEFAKLKQRLSKPDNNSGTGKLKVVRADNSNQDKPDKGDSLAKLGYGEATLKPLINPLIFGAELYTSVSPSFEPNQNLAVPVNYVLGPTDQIQVSVYGVQQYDGEFTVSSEGSINIPDVGQIKIGGMTIEVATQKIKAVMANTVYPYLRSGEAKLSVTLSNIRTIQVNIIGANRPGTYRLSSLSTVFNALYVSGGPSAFGSFREIELVRNNKPERKIDLYRMLMAGDQSDNIGLKDNDVIRIPAYKTRVEFQGQVKRPGIFEVLPGETFADILAFASGFTDTAYQSSVKVYQRSATERKVQDLDAKNYNTYHPQIGDLFVVSKILNRFQNRVTISGSVFRPDVYELSPDLTVADLIRKADGLTEDAFTSRGQIIRLQEDLTRSIYSFDIKKALAGDPANNLVLKREDEVFISSVKELRDSFVVTVQGEIRVPGKYDYVENLTLKDLILQAGGFTDAAYKSIEIARLLKRDSVTATDNRASNIINTEVSNDDISLNGANIPLQPFDVVTVRRKAGYTLPETVLVSGQVQYPGPYALSSRSERVSDILKRAGGYTPDAFPQGAYLKRYKSEEEKKKAEEIVKNIQKRVTDSTTAVANEILRDYDKVPLDLAIILTNPGSVEDILLKAKDELFIPKFDAQVRVSGEVLLATQVPYQRKNNLRDYISEAGGFSTFALRKKTYVVYANGKAATTKHFLFFKFYPKILPGSELIVPKKPEKKGSSLGEIIGISSALASLAGVVIALLRL